MLKNTLIKNKQKATFGGYTKRKKLGQITVMPMPMRLLKLEILSEDLKI